MTGKATFPPAGIEDRNGHDRHDASRSTCVDPHEHARVGVVTTSREGLILEAGPSVLELLGVPHGNVVGKPLSNLLHPGDRDECGLRLRKLVEEDAPQAWDLRMVRPDASSFWAHAQATRAQGDTCLMTFEDITERKKLEDAQLFLLKPGHLLRDGNVFRSLARYLADALGIDCVRVVRLLSNKEAAETVAVYVDGRFEDNTEQALKDTACGEAVGNTIRCFDAGVRRLFPRDAVLRELAAESYVGATLWGTDGKPIGVIAIIGRTPLTNPRLAERVLELSAVRAAYELEREQAGAEILALAKFPSENPNPVLRLDRSGVVLYANEAAGVLLSDWGCPVGGTAPDVWKDAVAAACDHDSPRTIEWTIGRETFSVVLAPVVTAGYVNLYGMNLSERRRTETALRDSEERYRVIVETARELIFFLDTAGRLRWHNPAFRNLIGQVAGEQDFLSLIHPDESASVAAAWQAIRAGETLPDKIRFRCRAADGGYRTLEGTWREISLAGETLWSVFVNDVTELVKLRGKIAGHEGIAGIVGRDPKMLELCASVQELAEVDVPVLIQGESGTGKELVASAIHQQGRRAAERFVAINCGAIPDTLLETELFGHVKGAFTGAHRDKKGRFELASGGTIFLDEVGDLSLAMQVKLLRVLQEGTFEKVGAEQPTWVNVRLISATNKDLGEEIKANRFREDLFYRLSVVPLAIPPLRERRSDIPLLAEHILDEEARRADRRHDPSRPPLRFTLARETLALLVAHSWPGNVRELQNILRFSLIKCKGNTIRPEHLPPSLATVPQGRVVARGRKAKLTPEAAALALDRAGGHPGDAARDLGVSRATLYRHLMKPNKKQNGVS